jgi:hypothetical protein
MALSIAGLYGSKCLDDRISKEAVMTIIEVPTIKVKSITAMLS